MIKPEYASNIIVGIVQSNRLDWYVAEKDIWVMDYRKWSQAFAENGHPIYENQTTRSGIEVIDTATYYTFKSHIQQFLVDEGFLSHLILSKQPVDRWEDIDFLCPSLFVDFDNLYCGSLFPEPFRFEEYVPDGWIGEYGNFLDRVPERNRYWVIKEVNYFAKWFAQQKT